MSKLILAPHADDEVLGCGGLISRHPADCAVAVLSDKGDGRMDEFYAAKEILGYADSFHATFATGTLHPEMRAVVGWLDGLLRETRPTELYLPAPGVHQDHQATFEAGMRAARKSYTGSAWFAPNVYLYDVPSYSAELYDVPYGWDHFVMLDEEQMKLKQRAIAAYESQNTGDFDPAHLARQHAEYLGARVNVKYVEQYATVRRVV